ncbi:MAG: Gfo/Idh/MocA family protein [bacterium]
MISLGQIGVGYWGKNLLRNFSSMSQCQVKMCCDKDEAIIAKVKRDYPGLRVTNDCSDVLADDQIDAVVIATLPETHFPIAREALLAGKDVFVEKPLVLDVSEGEELVKLAERGERILMVGHVLEYHPALHQLKEYITSGELGNIYYIYSTRVNLGKIRQFENALWSFGPHDVSLILYLLGQVPIEVTAVGESYLQKGIQDVTFATLHFPGRTMAHIHVSWLDPHKIRKVTVVGSKKMAVFDDMESTEMIRIYDKGVDQRLDYESYGESLSLRIGDIYIPRVVVTEPLRLECHHFIDCVMNRTSPRSDGRDGLSVVRVLDAAQKSMESGGTPVKIEEGLT